MRETISFYIERAPRPVNNTSTNHGTELDLDYTCYDFYLAKKQKNVLVKKKN